MKRIISTAVAVMMLLCILPHGAFAKEKSTPTVYVENATVRQGHSVDVDIVIENNPGVSAFDMGITYDSNALTLTNVVKGTALVRESQSSTTFSPDYASVPYNMIWVSTSEHDCEDNGTVFTLTFEASSNANLGQVLIGLTCNFFDAEVMPVAFAVENGYITVQGRQFYSVLFKDWDGKVLSEQTVEEGEAALSPSDPIRTGYIFMGWDKDFSNVQSDLTINAMYEIRKYTVLFKDWDGRVLKTQEVEHGKSATAPENPEREGFVFVLWDTDYTNVTRDITVTAVYSPIMYMVRFVDYDDTPIMRVMVPHGSAAVPPTNPVREGYTFTGWDKDYTNVTSDMIIKAQYTVNQYTVNYYVDGELYGTQTYDFGASITPLAEPERNNAVFSGWSDIPQTMPANNVNVYGTFEDAYTVVFQDYDGTPLSVQLVEHGESAVAPDAPEREGYVFTGWDRSFDNITENTTITAQYEILTFVVRFIDYDDSLIAEVQTEYGTAATAPAIEGREGYVFTGWDKDISCVTSDMTVRAMYEVLTYTVKFYDYDGVLLKTDTVEYGKSAVAPEIPMHEGLSFIGWDSDFSTVKSDMTVTAQYEIAKYTVIFADHDGTVLSTQTVEHGAGAVEPEQPYRDGYVFKGWDKDFARITADITVTAVYVQCFTVTFIDSLDGSVIAQSKVEKGESAIAPIPPQHEGYSFAGWDKSTDNITADTEIMALYEADGVLGDANMDGNVNTADAVTILRASAGIITLTDEQTIFADTNHDEAINTGDAVNILKLAAGLISELK